MDEDENYDNENYPIDEYGDFNYNQNDNNNNNEENEEE